MKWHGFLSLNNTDLHTYLMASLPFRSIKGFSSLFADFIENSHFIASRFPNNSYKELSENELSSFSEGYNRTSITSLVNRSMSDIALTDKQNENIARLGETNTLTVITGQQVGFLGGPLYTFYKITSAIQLAETLRTDFPTLDFVPVFWVEDNDHDREEAALAFMPDKTGIPLSFVCPTNNGVGTQTPVSALTISESIHDVIGSIEEQLPNTPYSLEFIELLKKVYTPDTQWSVAFIRLLQEWFGDKGLLFVRASDARKAGLFKNVVVHEITNPEKTLTVVHSANEQLIENGYKPQVIPSTINLFYHTETERIKITTEGNLYSAGNNQWTHEQLLSEAIDFPERFSPNVLLRPLCQDSIFPTFAYVAGPGEIAYMAQLKECYEEFGIRMPAIIPRYSATLMLPNHLRQLEKSEHPIEFYLQPFKVIEQTLSKELDDGTLDTLFQTTISNVLQQLEPLRHYAIETDATLSGAVASAEKGMRDGLEGLVKKIKSARKRNEQTLFDRAKTLNNFVFPDGKAQERVFGFGAITTKTSAKAFSEILSLFSSMPYNIHHIIVLTH